MFWYRLLRGCGSAKRTHIECERVPRSRHRLGREIYTSPMGDRQSLHKYRLHSLGLLFPMTTDKTNSPAGATSFAAIPSEFTFCRRPRTLAHVLRQCWDSWWRDPGLRMNVMHCMGLCFCVYYLGCKSCPHHGPKTVSDECADDASLLTGLQAVPACTVEPCHPNRHP
jgi:hypothetical protein